MALVLASACGNIGATGIAVAATSSPAAQLSATPIASASPSALSGTLSITPSAGTSGSGAKITGSLGGNLASPVQAIVVFHANPAVDLDDGTPATTHYTGPIWPSQWNVNLNSTRRFTLTIKVPRVVQEQGSDRLWLIRPGPHSLTLDVGGIPVAPAIFTVEAAPPPSATPTTETIYQNLWPVDAATIWLTGERCQAAPNPTPDSYGNLGTQQPDTCRGLLELSHDAGRSWAEQPLPDPTMIPQTIAFSDALHGVMILTTKLYCAQGACSSVIFLTHDGGQHWVAVYHTDPNTPDLIERGHPVIAKSVAFTALHFTSMKDGWASGTGCSDLGGEDCQPVLLGTNDGGVGWSQIALPELACPCDDMVHSTSDDGWILASASDRSPRLIVTHDGGQSWSEVTDPASRDFAYEQQIYFRSTNIGWLLSGGESGAGQQTKTLYQTTDGGQNWTAIAGAPFGDQSQALPSSGYVGPIDFSTDQTGWIIASRLGLLRSTDGGHRWATVPSIGYQDSLAAIRFSDEFHGWLLSTDQLWTTVDGGDHWAAISLPGD